jgi:hypothetical protein
LICIKRAVVAFGHSCRLLTTTLEKTQTRSRSRDLPHSMGARPDLTFISAPVN